MSGGRVTSAPYLGIMNFGVGRACGKDPFGSEGSALVDVFVDGSVRYGDLAAVAWYVSPQRWGAASYREANSTAVEADAIAFGLESVGGPVRIHSDCKTLVHAFDPSTAELLHAAWKVRGRSRILAAMDAALGSAEGRPVQVVHVPGHDRRTPLETRLADYACRYVMVRHLASGMATLRVGPDDLPELAVYMASEPLDEAFAWAAGEDLRSLGIFDGRHPGSLRLPPAWRIKALQALGPKRLAQLPLPARPPFAWIPG